MSDLPVDQLNIMVVYHKSRASLTNNKDKILVTFLGDLKKDYVLIDLTYNFAFKVSNSTENKISISTGVGRSIFYYLFESDGNKGECQLGRPIVLTTWSLKWHRYPCI